MAKKEAGPPVLPWPPAIEFPDRLARLRRLFRRYGRDETNEAIGQACGVHPNTVSNWAGGQEPKGEPLFALARFFFVEPEWLLSGRGSPSRYAPEDPTRKRVGPKPGD